MYTCTTAELLTVALPFVQVLLTELCTRCTKSTLHMLSLVGYSVHMNFIYYLLIAAPHHKCSKCYALCNRVLKCLSQFETG